MPNTRSSRDRFAELLFYVVVALVAYLAMQVVWPFVAPLAWAAILAMSLRPAYLKLCIRLSNGHAALATTTLAALLIIAPAVFLGSILVQELPVARAYLRQLSSTTPDQISRAWAIVRLSAPIDLPPDPMLLISEGLQKAAAVLVPQAGSLLADLVSTIGSLLVMLFALFFLLRDGRTYAEFTRRLLPFTDQESDRLIVETRDLVVASVGAGLVVAGVQGLIGGLTFWILGIPAPAVWGVVLGICSLLPVVGAAIVWVPVALWLFLSGQVTTAIILTAVSALVLSSVDNVLRPILLSGRTTASGLVVFIGLLGGASAFGFIGLVLGPIVLVTAGTLIDVLTRRAILEVDEIRVIE
ncbi:MAG TPA: AI-2E family transporter [Vicinamibacterales bacterium]|nr:AI-2E family transporter [Vicinamibacterales bacterium]